MFNSPWRLARDLWRPDGCDTRHLHASAVHWAVETCTWRSPWFHDAACETHSAAAYWQLNTHVLPKRYAYMYVHLYTNFYVCNADETINPCMLTTFRLPVTTPDYTECCPYVVMSNVQLPSINWSVALLSRLIKGVTNCLPCWQWVTSGFKTWANLTLRTTRLNNWSQSALVPLCCSIMSPHLTKHCVFFFVYL